MKFYVWTISVLLALSTLSCTSKSDKKAESAEPEETFDIDLADISMRDPFILADPETQSYYIPANGGKNIKMYKSKDLKKWKDLGVVFQPKEDFWGKTDFWAPDLYIYDGKYYLFVTFSSTEGIRGTSVLVADKADGPYEPLVNTPLTPADWMALDGALYVDDEGTPWHIYCHEWLQVKDGEVIAQKLTKDLKTTDGEPVVLFKASQAPWTPDGKEDGNYVTDAPIINKMSDGKLIMIWSSFGKDGKYNIGVCYSEDGVLGPWIHGEESLVDNNGGHGMLFKDFEGNMRISYHSPNDGAPARIIISPVKYENGKFTIVK
ncbi:MAG: glycoside hydrolase family 43 protein [Prevotella sp.]|jgi:hypothetical protein|nr:glycoside hydrolase family 43 protein [Prevotella sp.]